jgi:ankyrin repeat protein
MQPSKEYDMFSCFSSESTRTNKRNKELCFAVADNNVDKVRSTLALGALVDIVVTPESRYPHQFRGWGDIPLVHFAAMMASQSTDILEQIINAGASLHKIYETTLYKTSGSILHNALNSHNYAPTFELLISAGADVNAVNNAEISVIQALLDTNPYYTYAEDLDQLSVLKVLIEKNVTLNDGDVKRVVSLITDTEMVTTKGLDILRLCIEKQIDIDPSPDATILHLLASKKIADDNDTPAVLTNLVEAAVAAGFPLDKQDADGRTALHIALLNKSVLFNYLVKFVENINIADNDRVTPLHLAAKNGIEYANPLLEKQADVHALDINSRTVMHYAGDQFVFNALVAKGAKIDEADNNGITPLMCAAQAGKNSLVLKLLGAGANIKAMDKDGKSIVFYASPKLHTLTLIQAEIGFRNLTLNNKHTMTMT